MARDATLLLIVLFLGAPSPLLAIEEDDAKSDEPAKEEKEEEGKKSFKSRFTDPEDGKFDLTAASKEGAGLFPIAIPFNEPATGPGLAIALAYFHGTKATQSSTPNGPKPPPTTTFGVAVGTGVQMAQLANSARAPAPKSSTTR